MVIKIENTHISTTKKNREVAYKAYKKAAMSSRKQMPLIADAQNSLQRRLSCSGSASSISGTAETAIFVCLSYVKCLGLGALSKEEKENHAVDNIP